MRWVFVVVLLLSLSFVSKLTHASPPVHQWSFGDVERGHDVTFDVDGNVYVLSAAPAPDTISVGSLTVRKYDPNGQPTWTATVTGDATPQTIDVDGDANVVLSAVVEGLIDFGNGVTSGDQRLAIVRYDTDGSVWTREFPNTTLGPVAFDTNGDIVFAAAFQEAVDFGGGALVSTDWRSDIAIVKYDQVGAFSWHRHVGGVDDQYPFAIATDQSNNIILTGSLHGSADFGGGALPAGLEGEVIFLAKIASDGSHVWSKSFGAGCCLPPSETGQGRGVSVDVDPAGNIAFTGSFSGTINFGGSDVTGSHPGGPGIFIASFDDDGSHRWSRGVTSSNDPNPRGIAMDSAGNVFITGGVISELDFGGGPIAYQGYTDIYLAAYGSTGDHLWSQGFGSEGVEQGTALSLDASGNIGITGWAYDPIDFGGGPITPAGMFVAKFASEEPNPVFITRFHAQAGAENVRLEWELWTDEAIAGISLFRSDARSHMIAIAEPHVGARLFVDKNVRSGVEYSYVLMVRKTDGEELLSQTETVTLRLLTESLGQNHPNPFNPSTMIDYTLGSRTRAIVNIYDASGRLVMRLDRGTQDAGAYQVEWNGRDLAERPVASGVYFYQLVATGRTETRKMVLLK